MCCILWLNGVGKETIVVSKRKSLLLTFPDTFLFDLKGQADPDSVILQNSQNLSHSDFFMDTVVSSSISIPDNRSINHHSVKLLL